MKTSVEYDDIAMGIMKEWAPDTSIELVDTIAYEMAKAYNDGYAAALAQFKGEK